MQGGLLGVASCRHVETAGGVMGGGAKDGQVAMGRDGEGEERRVGLGANLVRGRPVARGRDWTG